MDLLPKVFRTEGNITDFESSKIYESILKETGMSKEDATHVTELVARRIIKYGIKFLSGPHIREIVCSILSEQHFENERKLYTRIGIPLMDYEKILDKGLNGNLVNPEQIHHWAANKIAEEYAHLRLLNAEESRAHLFGDIHIEGLNYFDSKPSSQVWDLRSIFKTGFPSLNNFPSIYRVKPANNIREAISHVSKWLTMIQSEFYGIQSLNFITNYLAPYVIGLSKETIEQAIRNLIHEFYYISHIVGREISPISISSSPTILKALAEVSAIIPGGKIKDVYGNYGEECLKIFNALTKIFKEGNQFKGQFNSPIHQIMINKNWLDVHDNAYLNVWNEIQATRNFYIVNLCPENYKKIINSQISNDDMINLGILQNISLNLPRYAYLSQNEDKFFEILYDKVNTCSGIFLKKYEIIKKRMKSGHLPLCNSSVDGNPIFQLKNQKFSISFIGLNETVKTLTNNELHEDLNSFSIGTKIVKELKDLCLEFSEKNKISHVLSENISKNAKNRFSRLDLKHFNDQINSSVEGDIKAYSNSCHFRDGVKMDLFNRVKSQGEFHDLIHLGATETVSLSILKENGINLKDFVNYICKETNLTQMKFIS